MLSVLLLFAMLNVAAEVTCCSINALLLTLSVLLFTMLDFAALLDCSLPVLLCGFTAGGVLCSICCSVLVTFVIPVEATFEMIPSEARSPLLR